MRSSSNEERWLCHGPAAQLDYQPLPTPQDNDEVALDQGVEDRSLQLASAAEGGEAALELLAHVLGLPKAESDVAKHGHASAASVTNDYFLDGPHVEDSPPLGALQRALDVGGSKLLSEAEQGQRDGRDRNGVQDGPVDGGQSG